MSLEEIIEKAKELAERPIGDVLQDWKAQSPDSKAVGWFPVYTPVELIHACGMFPVGVTGGGQNIEIAHADSRFQSFVCSIVKSTLELGLVGQLRRLDGIIFHSICDPAKNLAGVFRRNFPGMAVEFIHFPQNMKSPLAEDYLDAEYRRVLEGLVRISGVDAGEEALQSSIETYNANRKSIRRLQDLRRRFPERLSASDSCALLRAGMRMPVDEHTAMLETVIDLAGRHEARAKDRIPVILEGAFCEPAPPALIQTIEEAGCYILDDDVNLGASWFTSDIEPNGDPLRALARSYLDRSVHSAVKHDLRYLKGAPLLSRLHKSGARAVLVLTPKFCEPALFDYALYKRALDEAGIPHLLLEFEEKMWIFDRIRGEVETFVESMLFD